MAPSNTTIIIVPGAWHKANSYEPLTSELKKSGYQVETIELPSVGPAKHLPNFNEDVTAIRQAIQKNVDQGREVVLVGHSYGSIPANEASKGLLTTDLGQNKGGIKHLFFMAAFIIDEGASLIGAFGGNPLPWFIISDDQMEVNPATPEEIFYNDLSETHQKDMVSRLKPQSYQVMHTPVTYAAWKHVPSTYLYCERDYAIPMQIQQMMVEGTAKGVSVRTEKVDAGHSPFLGKPEEAAKAIIRAAES